MLIQTNMKHKNTRFEKRLISKVMTTMITTTNIDGERNSNNNSINNVRQKKEYDNSQIGEGM